MLDDNKVLKYSLLVMAAIVVVVIAFRIIVATLGLITSYLVFYVDQISYLFYQWDIDQPSCAWLALGYSAGLVLGFMKGLWETKQSRNLMATVFLIAVALALYNVWPNIVFSGLLVFPYLATIFLLNIVATVSFLLIGMVDIIVIQLIKFMNSIISFLLNFGVVPNSVSFLFNSFVQPTTSWLISGFVLGTILGLIRGLRFIKKI